MQKNANKSYKGLVIVDDARIRAIYDLVLSFQEKPKSSKENDLIDTPKIEVTLKSREKYYPINCEEIFEIQNRKSDRIERIDISCGLFGKIFVKVTLGGYYSTLESAEIYASGEAQLVDIAIKKFDDLINKEKEIFETIISLNPFVLAILLVTILNFLFSSISFEDIPHIFDGGPSSQGSLFLYAMLGIAIPIFGLTYSLHNLIYNYFGRCVFYWSDGKSRYEKHKKITLFLFWTVPLAFVMKIATSNF